MGQVIGGVDVDVYEGWTDAEVKRTLFGRIAFMAYEYEVLKAQYAKLDACYRDADETVAMLARRVRELTGRGPCSCCGGMKR